MFPIDPILPPPSPPAAASAPSCRVVGKKRAGRWQEVPQREHFVQIYAHDDHLTRSLAEYALDALEKGERVLVIATAAHRRALDGELRLGGIDIASALVRRHYIACDAAETLAGFIVDDRVDAARFEQVVGGLLLRTVADGRPLRAFGEMVALLWEQGLPAAAIELEEAWNALAARHPFSLFCAYPSRFFTKGAAAGFHEVCCCHARIIPEESQAA